MGGGAGVRGFGALPYWVRAVLVVDANVAANLHAVDIASGMALAEAAGLQRLFGFAAFFVVTSIGVWPHGPSSPAPTHQRS